MKNVEALRKFGLTDKEASVYVTCLELGRARVQAIAKKTGLSRSTAYSVLESLIQRRLVFALDDRAVREYTPEDPEKILRLQQEALTAIKQTVPELKDLYRSVKGRPRVKHYEGLREIKMMYDEILRSKGLKEYLIMAAEQSWAAMDERWVEEFKKRRASAKIKTRLITEDSPLARQRQADGMKYLSEVRILTGYPPEEWVAGTYIFYDKVIFVEYKKDLVAVEIQSPGMARLMKMAFETIWQTLPPTPATS